jgi:hypothetical protein
MRMTEKKDDHGDDSTTFPDDDHFCVFVPGRVADVSGTTSCFQNSYTYEKKFSLSDSIILLHNLTESEINDDEFQSSVHPSEWEAHS